MRYWKGARGLSRAIWRGLRSDPLPASDPTEILIDARGHRCPVPTLRLRRAVEAASPGARLRLLADDPLAKIDVPHLAASLGLGMIEMVSDEAGLSFLVQKPQPEPEPEPEP
jgi:tRNA 2-thiouridine synthesizing protein A